MSSILFSHSNLLLFILSSHCLSNIKSSSRLLLSRSSISFSMVSHSRILCFLSFSLDISLSSLSFSLSCHFMSRSCSISMRRRSLLNLSRSLSASRCSNWVSISLSCPNWFARNLHAFFSNPFETFLFFLVSEPVGSVPS
ncbi:unnamed protein product [Coffea canephora]|uniref:Uncharacterized protein n=1 Tax=Coffea canephora TaxID=49390 RepID=A0A068USF4_COFCA|nr:unnamed protein product [Coffea canephora]